MTLNAVADQATKNSPAAFIAANSEVLTPPLVPEIRLHLASEALPFWHTTEEQLAELDLPPPYWAFAWAGGQGLARYLLDQPEAVRGKRVLDIAAGSGLQGIAAMKAGAASVEAAEVDAYAAAAIGLNAALNGVAVTVRLEDLVGRPNPGWDVVLAGDICYEHALALRVSTWLTGLARDGALVLLGDPGRTYLPRCGLERVTAYAVKTSRALEDTDLRNAVVWRVTGKTA